MGFQIGKTSYLVWLHCNHALEMNFIHLCLLSIFYFNFIVLPSPKIKRNPSFLPFFPAFASLNKRILIIENRWSCVSCWDLCSRSAPNNLREDPRFRSLGSDTTARISFRWDGTRSSSSGTCSFGRCISGCPRSISPRIIFPGCHKRRTRRRWNKSLLVWSTHSSFSDTWSWNTCTSSHKPQSMMM